MGEDYSSRNPEEEPEIWKPLCGPHGVARWYLVSRYGLGHSIAAPPGGPIQADRRPAKTEGSVLFLFTQPSLLLTFTTLQLLGCTQVSDSSDSERRCQVQFGSFPLASTPLL